MFHPFPRLPPETRCRIWYFAHPGPRVVESNEGDRKHLVNDLAGFSITETRTRKPPTILHVNQESRSEALKFYELVPLRNLMGCRQVKESHPDGKIYFNFEVDTLYISRASMWNHHEGDCDPFEETGDVVARVKHVAIDSIAAQYLEHISYIRIAYYFRDLETCTLVRDWSTWNMPAMDGYNDRRLRKKLDEPMDMLGLSYQERCRHEREVMREYTYEQDVAMDDSNSFTYTHFKLLHMAYFGNGELVPAQGDWLDEDEEGPLQDKILKGPEVDLLPQHIKNALKQLDANEEAEYARCDICTTSRPDYHNHDENKG